MKLSKVTIADFFVQISEPFAPNSEAERRSRARWAAIILTALVLLYWWLSI